MESFDSWNWGYPLIFIKNMGGFFCNGPPVYKNPSKGFKSDCHKYAYTYFTSFIK